MPDDILKPEANTNTGAEGEPKPEAGAGAGTTVVTKPEEGAKPEAGKPEAKPEGERIVPTNYELNLPEDSFLDSNAVQRVTELAKAKGLTQDEAVAELKRENDVANAVVEGQKATLESRSKTWVEEAKADEEIGGAAFDANAELAKRVVNRFGEQSFKDVLNETKLGNHPGLVKMLVRIGRSMSDDQLVMPGSQPATKKSAEDVLYGNPPPSEG